MKKALKGVWGWRSKGKIDSQRFPAVFLGVLQQPRPFRQTNRKFGHRACTLENVTSDTSNCGGRGPGKGPRGGTPPAIHSPTKRPYPLLRQPLGSGQLPVARRPPPPSLPAPETNPCPHEKNTCFADRLRFRAASFRFGPGTGLCPARQQLVAVPFCAWHLIHGGDSVCRDGLPAFPHGAFVNATI